MALSLGFDGDGISLGSLWPIIPIKSLLGSGQTHGVSF